MPYFKIETNASLVPSEYDSALKTLSALIASQLGKSEDYVMTRIEFAQAMSFAGTNEFCAICTLTSLGLDDQMIPEFSRVLTKVVSQVLSVKPERIYIHFQSPQRKHFAFNGKPFA